MAEIGEAGHWAILGKLPIQERHLSDVKDCSLKLAAEEDPDS